MTQGILSHIFKTNLCFDFVFKITGIAGYLQSLLYVHASYRVELLTQGFPVLTTGKKLTVYFIVYHTTIFTVDLLGLGEPGRVV